ncbi:MAG: AIM24 family protein [Bacteroidetes bacterium]|nr:AIM24 family protein [Bacteroidota bacterium]
MSTPPSLSASDHDPRPTPSNNLHEFLAATAERDHPGDVFELESDKMLEVHVRGRVWSKLGAMVAYRGNVAFKREGMLEGGMMKALMRAVSSEMEPLTKIEGQGRVYLADSGKNISVLRLTSADALSVNGHDLLAFEDSIQHNIVMHRRMAGWMSGGLFSVTLTGQGLVAITTHGKPLTLRVTPDSPVTTDPNATVAWSANLQPEVTMDTSFRSLTGRGGGESIQMVFRGNGFVVVQPYEEVPQVVQGG